MYGNDKDYPFLMFAYRYIPQRGWAAPGGTAIPGQPAGWAKQASIRTPKFKNWVNSLGVSDPRSSY